jgi:uncharacterized OsmC-like protein
MTTRGVCCTIDYQKVKRNLDRWRKVIQSGETAEGISECSDHGGMIAPVEALCRKVDESVEEATFPLLPGNFVIRSDEQAEPIYYGKGTAPQPLDIFLAGIGMCMASIYGEGAADLGVTINSVEIRVRGDLDMKGILDLDGKGYGARPGFSRITYTVSIQSNEPLEKIRDLIHRVERACPAHNTVMHGTSGVFVYQLNGERLAP